MADITPALVGKLREMTSAGLMDCKNALVEAGGNLDGAVDILRKKGQASAAKKAGREAKDGLVAQAVVNGGKVGVLVEINCETDFVARTEEFRQLAHDLAMQVAAMNPAFVNKEDVPSDEERSPEEAALMSQAFIKDPSRTIDDMVKAMASKTGENIRVRRFSRFELGG